MVKMGGKVEERWRKVHGGGGDVEDKVEACGSENVKKKLGFGVRLS